SSFSYYFPQPPSLHSFPTRRSSDLPNARTDDPSRGRGISADFCALRRRSEQAHQFNRARRVEYNSDRSGAALSECACKIQSQVRSEEHTSELQSRVDLVCRLLLEKK